MKNPRNFFGSCGDFFIFALQTTINMEKGQIEVKEKRYMHSCCFFMIHRDDPEELAEKHRNLCESEHNENPFLEFHLYDEQQKTITHYGHGTKSIVEIKDTKLIKLANALSILNSDKNKIWSICKGYDYAWLLFAINKNLIPGFNFNTFNSASSFIKCVESLKYSNIVSKSTINRYYKEIVSSSLPMQFNGPEVDAYETKRRNAIVRKFIELMTE